MAAQDVFIPEELQRYLVPNEVVLVNQRQHWVAVAEPIASAFVGLFVVGWIDSALGGSARGLRNLVILGWLALVLRAAWMWWNWYRDSFIVTDRRLIETYGIITRKVAMMPMAKVTDMGYVRSPLGKIFGYGKFALESAGQDQALGVIKFVRHPDATYRKITSVIFAPAARRATDVRPPPGSGSQLPVVEPDDVWWRK